MTNQHPITPPPELRKKWLNESPHTSEHDYLIDKAAQWGADQELEACCRWIEAQLCMPPDARADVITQLDGSRRPKPPSLKEQALALLDDASDRLDAVHENTIRRALEALPE